MNYTIKPERISKWSNLENFDEYEAKGHGWPESLIAAAIQEIQRREVHAREQERQEGSDER